KKEAAVKKPKTNVTRGTIYLDLSTSMQGYLNDPGSSIPFTLLQHILHNGLQTSFHHVDISSLIFNGFGREVVESEISMKYYAIAEVKTIKEETVEISPRTRYKCSETNIVGVLLEAASNQNALSVIVTDGSQDVSGTNGKLAPGFDRPEFVQAVCKGLIDKGFGIWLVGIMNDFDGYYYNIIPNREGEINKAIRVIGKRPVYCWILSKDITKGRAFVQYLHDDLMGLANSKYRENGNSKYHEMVRVIEIAPGVSPEILLTEPNPDRHFDYGVDVSEHFSYIHSWDHHPAYPGKNVNIATADFPTNSAGDVLFILQGKLNFENRYNWDSFPMKMWHIKIDETQKIAPKISTGIRGITGKSIDPAYRFLFVSF
ncbi:MAG: hypothetical protein GY757_53900, partial [bacterium]|nr:hypothetical protein [bacterium]